MRKFNCGVIADIVVGVVVIVLSVFGYTERQPISRYMVAGFGIALLIWAITKIALNIGTKCSLCPQCGRKFSMKEKQAFLTVGIMNFGKASPCPGCQTVLIPSKWPLVLINYGSLALGVALLISLFDEHPDGPQYDYLKFVPLLVGFLLIEIGSTTLRYEIVDEAEAVAKGEPG
jgi:hypothetical protein